MNARNLNKCNATSHKNWNFNKYVRKYSESFMHHFVLINIITNLSTFCHKSQLLISSQATSARTVRVSFGCCCVLCPTEPHRADHTHFTFLSLLAQIEMEEEFFLFFLLIHSR